ncbi:MAG: ferritin-like domain-containing protein [Planctomycetaceae bacterium]|nr:ferritin-like domain-containing protein [Planctomycetaceae bacterium]
MRLKDMHALFIHELKDLYSAEKQLTKALPKMAKAASNEELRRAFEEHAQETESQFGRLEEMFENLDAAPRGAKCPAMEGLVEEAKELLEEEADPHVLDAALICAAQRVEHYEIAGYGCLRALAEQLGMREVASTLQETLDEEKKTNERLTKLALSEVNEEAMVGAGKRE